MLNKEPEGMTSQSSSSMFMLFFGAFALLAIIIGLIAGFSVLYILDGVLEFLMICWIFYVRNPQVLKSSQGARIKMIVTAFVVALGAVILVSKVAAFSSVLGGIVALACLVAPMILFMKK
jgi:hypothetical protein